MTTDDDEPYGKFNEKYKFTESRENLAHARNLCIPGPFFRLRLITFVGKAWVRGYKPSGYALGYKFDYCFVYSGQITGRHGVSITYII